MAADETQTLVAVLDTAVKIGLGALISAAAAYVMNKLSHKNQTERDDSASRERLLLLAVEGINESTQIMNQSLQDLTVAANTEKSDGSHEGRAKTFGEAVNKLVSSITYCRLIGANNLANMIEQKFSAYEAIRKHIAAKGLEYDKLKVRRILKDYKDLNLDFATEYERAFASLR